MAILGLLAGPAFANTNELSFLLNAFTKDEREIVNVNDFGAVGDCVVDDTAAIQAAINLSDRIFISKPSVCYLVTSITVGANKTVLTDGLTTVFRQMPGQSMGTRVIRITGSNVYLGSLSVSGNITTDENEQQHAVFVFADAATGDIENVTIEDIRGTDIRGDVLYVGQVRGYSVRNVRIGSIVGNNVYRNIVSFVGGEKLIIGSIAGFRVGLAHFDAEPNIGSGPAIGININYIKGRMVGLNGPTPADYIDDVRIDVMDLDPAHSPQSDPVYKSGAAILDALTLRNVKSASIGQFKVNGFGRSALFTISNSGEIGARNIVIENAAVTNCAISDVIYRAFFNLSETYLVVESLEASISGDRYLFNNGSRGGRISNAMVYVGAGASFIKSSNNFKLVNIKQAGAGIFINGGGGHHVVGGSIFGTRLSSFGAASIFEGVTATSSEFVFDSANRTHIVRNSTLKAKDR